MKAPEYLCIGQKVTDLFKQTLELSLVVEPLTPRNREIAVSLLMGEEWPEFYIVEETSFTIGGHAMYMMLPTPNEKIFKHPNEGRDKYIQELIPRMLEFIENPKHQKHNG